MTLEPVSANPIAWPGFPALAQTPVAGATPSFEQMLTGAMSNMNHQLTQADKQLQMLASGKAESLHEAMVAIEQARLSMQLMVQVRNRLMEAYQQMMQMQV